MFAFDLMFASWTRTETVVCTPTPWIIWRKRANNLSLFKKKDIRKPLEHLLNTNPHLSGWLTSVISIVVLELWVFYEMFLLPSATQWALEHCPRTCLVVEWTLVIGLLWDLFATLPQSGYAPEGSDGTPANPSAINKNIKLHS